MVCGRAGKCFMAFNPGSAARPRWAKTERHSSASEEEEHVQEQHGLKKAARVSPHR